MKLPHMSAFFAGRVILASLSWPHGTPLGKCRLVYNSCVLVIGLGAVGSYVAGVLRAMGSRVVATRRSAVAEGERLDNGVEVSVARWR